MVPSPLVLDHCGWCSYGHHPARHADAAAVSGEIFVQAGGSGRSKHPVGQCLPGQAEYRFARGNAVRLDFAQGAGGAFGDCHGRWCGLVLPHLDGDASRAVLVVGDIVVGDVAPSRGGSLRPPPASPPMIARSTVARAWAAAGVSTRPPRSR